MTATALDRQIELHTLKAVRRIVRDMDTARANGSDRSKQVAVGSLGLTEAVRAFDAVSASAVASQRLHAAILNKLIETGVVHRHGPALVLA